jgi:NAD(P)H-dependent flavin oxidoreductase YrpB (nitropropane dioxygenase family)
MNGVSDLNLAVAVSKAGIVPSLSFANYKRMKDTKLSADVSKFKGATGTNEIMISITDSSLIEHIDLIHSLGVSHIEIIILTNLDTRYEQRYSGKNYIKSIKRLQQSGVKILIKSIAFPFDDMVNDRVRFSISEHFMDGLIFKGNEAAGIVRPSKLSLSSRVKEANERYENKKAVIPCGGIATKETVDSILLSGATSVGVGSLFALSEESRVARESKIKIIQDNKRQLDKLSCERTHQNAFVIEQINKEDDTNHTNSLLLGVNGMGGHLFMGTGIKEVNEILPVKEIVARLIS